MHNLHLKKNPFIFVLGKETVVNIPFIIIAELSYICIRIQGIKF